MYKEAKKYYEEKRVVGDYLTKESVISMMTGFANNHIEQLTIPRVVSTSCDLSKEQLKRKIQMADMQHQIKRERT